MALKRFRIEVEGIDQEDVEQRLDNFSLGFMVASRNLESNPSLEFECTDERISAIKRNGQPLMYGRRVFKVIEKKEVADASSK